MGAQQQYREEQRMQEALEPIHLEDFGDVSGPKPEGRFRLVGGNPDVFPTDHFQTGKADDLQAFRREHEADALLCQESGLNWDRVPRAGKLKAIMKTDLIMRTVTAHNEYEMEIGK